MDANYNAYSAAMDSISVGILIGYSIFVLALSVIILVAYWKIFKKAGKPGWAAIVPFYNMYCLYEMTFGNGWMFLLSFIPCVNFVIGIMMTFKLAKAFGKGTGFGFGLLFLQPIFILILGLGSAEYVGPQ